MILTMRSLFRIRTVADLHHKDKNGSNNLRAPEFQKVRRYEGKKVGEPETQRSGLQRTEEVERRTDAGTMSTLDLEPQRHKGHKEFLPQTHADRHRH